VLWHLQLPLAVPSLMAGLRVATVTAVGVATIAAAIGAGGLGVFVFRGIATVNNTLLLAGALPAAALALAADAALGLLEQRLGRRAAPRASGGRGWRVGGLRGLRGVGSLRRALPRRRLPALGVALGLASALAALLAALLLQPQGPLSRFHPLQPAARPPAAEAVVIGAKGFTEQLILGELLAQEIEARTALAVRREFSLGSTFLLHQALRSGRLDGYVEYTGTAWTAILRQPPLPPSMRASLLARTRELYASRYQLRLFPSLGFENTFALLVRRGDAQRLGLRRISDLAGPTGAARRWRAGFGYEFLNRADGFPGLARRYGLSFASPPKAMDLGLTYRALADGQVDLIAGDSTNGLIASLDLHKLDDDRGYFPPYDAVPVFRTATLRRHPELVPVLDGLAGRLSAATMQQLNAAVDLHHQTPEAVVRRWRAEGLAKPGD
jgi:osmoprotectant transport system permease protein